MRIKITQLNHKITKSLNESTKLPEQYRFMQTIGFVSFGLGFMLHQQCKGHNYVGLVRGL
jgi:hypothetical protein